MTLAADPIIGQLIQPGPDLLRGVAALVEANEDYCKADSYYAGDVPEKFASPRFRRALARSGVSARFNFAKTPVDALVDRLEIASITSTDAGQAETIADLWAQNQLDLEAPQIHRNAGKHGDAYVIVWPLDELGDLADGEDEAPVRIGIFYNSAETTRIIYDPENPLEKQFLIKRWRTDTGQWRVDLYYPHHIEQWITKPKTEGDKPGDYVPFVSAWEVDEETQEVRDVWPLENPFGQIPGFHFRNDRQYGRPEHEGFYGAQDAITKLIMGHLGVVDYQTFPQRVALAEGSADSSEAADIDEDAFAFEVEGVGGSTTRTTGGEGRSSFTSDPGSVWWMQGVKSVVEFKAADPSVFFDPMAQYLRFGAQICTTPLRMFDYENAQLPSGASQAQADGPFVKKVRNRQLSYGGTWQDVFTFALRVLGYADPDVQVNWAPAHAAEGTEALEIANLKVSLGVPKKQVLLELGYTADQVEEWFPANAPAPAPLPAPPVDDEPPTI